MLRFVAVLLGGALLVGCASVDNSEADRGSAVARKMSSGREDAENALRAALEGARRQATTALVSFVATNAGPELRSASGTVDFRTAPISFSLTMYDGQESVHLISVAGVGYVQDPDRGPAFIRFKIDDPENPFGAIAGGIDPLESYEELAGGVVGVRAEDREAGGEALRAYIVTVDPALITAQPSDPELGDLPGTVEYEFSFDSLGRLRKVEGDLGAELLGFRYSFTNWGESEGVSAPPKELVIKAPDGDAATT